MTMRDNFKDRWYQHLGAALKGVSVVMASAFLIQAGMPAAMAAVEPGPAASSAVKELDLYQGKSILLKSELAVSRISVSDPAVADVKVLSPKEIYVLGKSTGLTNVTLWDKAKRVVAVYDIYVTTDVGVIQHEIKSVANGGVVRVRAVGHTLLLEGHVPDARTAAKVAELAEAIAGKKPVNMLSVDGVQQVILEVKIAEVDRTLADRLGINLALNGAVGKIDWNMLSQFVGVDANGNQLTPNLGFNHKGGTGNAVGVEAQKQDGLVKILAEPNIVAMSGQEGSFLAGGEILIPVASTQGAVTLETKDFGVGLRFTPTVLEDGRINMRVLPEVTEVQGFQTVNVGTSSAVVPTLTTRRASTTVELRDGQSLAIGGLLKDNVKEAINRLPILGEIPILGALFRSSEYQTDRSELLIVVTPHLVKPLSPNYALPTDAFKEPSRAQFFLGGRMEGTPEKGEAAPAPAPTPAPAPAPDANADGHQLK